MTRARWAPRLLAAVVVAGLISSCTSATQEDEPPTAAPASTQSSAPEVGLETSVVEGLQVTAATPDATVFSLRRPTGAYDVVTLPVTAPVTVGGVQVEPLETGQRVIVQVTLPDPDMEDAPTDFAVTAPGADPVPISTGQAWVIDLEGGSVEDVAIEVTFEGRTGPYSLDGAWLGSEPEPVFMGATLDVGLPDEGDSELVGTMTGGVLLVSWDPGTRTWADDGKLWLQVDYAFSVLRPTDASLMVSGGTATIVAVTDEGDFSFDVQLGEADKAQYVPVENSDPIQVPDTISEVSVQVSVNADTTDPFVDSPGPQLTVDGASDTTLDVGE